MQRTGNFTSQGVSYVSSTSSLCAANSASASGGRIILYYTIGPRLDLARAAGGNIPSDFRRSGIAILRRTPSASSSSSTSPGDGCTGLFFQRKLPSLSREGHPTIAHRFNGGKAIPTNRQVPSGTADSHECRDRAAVVSKPQKSPCEFLSPLSGLWPRATRGPTAEAVGDCRVFLAGQRVTSGGPSIW